MSELAFTLVDAKNFPKTILVDPTVFDALGPDWGDAARTLYKSEYEENPETASKLLAYSIRVRWLYIYETYFSSHKKWPAKSSELSMLVERAYRFCEVSRFLFDKLQVPIESAGEQSLREICGINEIPNSMSVLRCNALLCMIDASKFLSDGQVTQALEQLMGALEFNTAGVFFNTVLLMKEKRKDQAKNASAKSAAVRAGKLSKDEIYKNWLAWQAADEDDRLSVNDWKDATSAAYGAKVDTVRRWHETWSRDRKPA